MLRDDPAQQLTVGDVALVEDPVLDEGERPGEQRIEITGVWPACSRALAVVEPM
nr:hypothetical protein [Nocardioides ungokensis]